MAKQNSELFCGPGRVDTWHCIQMWEQWLETFPFSDTISYSLKFKVQWITVPLPLSALVYKQLIPWARISFEVLTVMQTVHTFFYHIWNIFENVL